jgi:hypothetical protein
MNKIEFSDEKRGKNIRVDVAACWDELTEGQFLEVVRNLPKIAAGGISDELLRDLLQVDKQVFKKINAVQKYYLQQNFAFLKTEAEMKRLIIQSFTVETRQYVGYQSGFSNTTWEEFIYADQYFMNNQFLNAVAVLYREKKDNHDGQSDVRIPFSIYGTEKRVQVMQHLDKEVVMGIALNYKALRERNIGEKYPFVFERGMDDVSGQGVVSWVQVHRNVLGEYFFEEEKRLKSNVHAVLHRINAIIEENKKKK